MTKTADLFKVFMEKWPDKSAQIAEVKCQYHLRIQSRSGFTSFCFKEAYLDHRDVQGYKQIKGCEVTRSPEGKLTVLGCDHVK